MVFLLRCNGCLALLLNIFVTRSSLPRRTVLAVATAATLSILLNVILIFKLTHKYPTALDDYQPLNTQSILNTTFFIAPPDPQENAIVTTLYSDAYAVAVATLGHSLNRVNSTALRILLYIPENVSPRALCIASSTGFYPHAVERIPPPKRGISRHLQDQYTKLTMWTLEEAGIKGIVYLDADMLARRNFDELFNLPFNFAAVPDVFLDSRSFALNFNAAMLFLRPSPGIFDDMLSKIGSASYKSDDADQSFLNHYYGKEAVRLPYVYNVNLAVKLRSPELWANLMREARIVHYTQIKPFIVEKDYSGKARLEIESVAENVRQKLGENGGMFDHEIWEWLRMWQETLRIYSEELTECRRISGIV
ncbi:uncharacterized protein FIBRA_06077 [Fibroporia radiculosa]|uniref:Nucleotide-diphospho-sugar transferase domain-containing protein n=1 Tax=Fibroporia radiculosa TaxID=599839 RepID=J4GS56_9APHY|nr:uncharacterized protein FIBRA_06077 [Fibroporia radiculosa]CCM03925.1 predicted protein [Fibroporia radiculosa]